MIENHREISGCTDKQLLKAFTARRDEAAFTELVARHSAMVQRVCWRVLGNEHDVEDCVQAVFMLLARRARLVAWQASIANWLYGAAWRIAKREWRRHLKAPSQEYEMNEYPQSAQAGVESDGDDQLELIEQRLYPAIFALPSRYRGPIVLCYLEGKSRQQACKELGIRESVLKGRLERGKQVLRKKFAACEDDPVAKLSSGALAVFLSKSALPVESIRQISQNAIGYALGSATTSVTTTSLLLSNGESLTMLLAPSIKVVLALVGVGVLTGIGYYAFAPSTVAPSPEPSVVAVTDDKVSEKDLATQRHLRAIAQAIHAYADANGGNLPPATIPNPNLPPEKRLSGFVAILPYLGIRPSFIDANDAEWNAWHADNAQAKALYSKIDLTKAWDDPANAEAARTIVPAFLSPMEASTTTRMAWP